MELLESPLDPLLVQLTAKGKLVPVMWLDRHLLQLMHTFVTLTPSLTNQTQF